ncbi:hypothetical protein PIB30_066715 [Stylosanthes scabra]|uniref:Uncharacterized protein n=1 Tax=Stylosanthes scabra TaxID=79078 RepID=A0ABU6XKL7_9FABA|nr:hypothetical protein [Stylosanthes scabra]
MTPYGSDDLRFLSPDWIRSGAEIRTWHSIVPIVCFNLVHMHDVDRVMRQLGADRPIPVDPVNNDIFLMTTSRGKDVWWPHIAPPKHGCDTRLIWSSIRLSRSQTSVAIGIIWIGGTKHEGAGSCWVTICYRIHQFWLFCRTSARHPPDIPLLLDAPARRRCRCGRAGEMGGPVRCTRTTRGEASTSHATPSTSRAGASSPSSSRWATLQSDIRRPIHRHHRSPPTSRNSQTLSMSRPRLHGSS